MDVPEEKMDGGCRASGAIHHCEYYLDLPCKPATWELAEPGQGMCAHMCARVYTCVHVCAHAYVCMRVPVCMCVPVCMRVRVRVRVRAHVCACARVCACACVVSID